MCDNPKINILCFKSLKTLLTKHDNRDVCKEDRILIVDDWPLKHMQNLELACIFSLLCMDQKESKRTPNGSIGNLAIDLLLYLISLRLYAIVFQYIKDYII